MENENKKKKVNVNIKIKKILVDQLDSKLMSALIARAQDHYKRESEEGKIEGRDSTEINVEFDKDPHDKDPHDSSPRDFDRDNFSRDNFSRFN